MLTHQSSPAVKFYAAPEAWDCRPVVSSDIYSLGVIAVVMMTGKYTKIDQVIQLPYSIKKSKIN